MNEAPQFAKGGSGPVPSPWRNSAFQSLIPATDGPSVIHPTIQALQKKALHELFDWLGLSVVPNQLLPVLDVIGDPGLTLERVIAAVGCDPTLVRRKDPEQIENLKIVFDLLVAVDVAGPYLKQHTLDRLESMAFSRQYSEIAVLSRTISCLASILIGRNRTASLIQFAAYKTFLSDIETFIADPFEATAEGASEALALSDAFVDAIEKYSDFKPRMVGIVARIKAVRTRTLDAAQLKQFDDLVLEADLIDGSLTANEQVGIDALAEALSACSRILEGLETLLEFSQESASSSYSDSTETIVERALRYFGFDPRARPSRRDIRAKWLVIIFAHHPDHAKDEADRAKRTRKAQEANALKDVLVAAFK